MDNNYIFSLFENLPENEELETTSFGDFKEHPLVKIGIFKKVLRNYEKYGNELFGFFEKMNLKLDIKEIQELGENLLYNKAWNNIDCIDINNEHHIRYLEITSNNEFIQLLNKCNKYFELREEYEKCGKLIKIKEKVENFLK